MRLSILEPGRRVDDRTIALGEAKQRRFCCGV
jgi:hypothetical protein